MRSQPFVALCALALTVTVAGAQGTQRDTAVSLPGISVTANREAAPILTTPLAISKITLLELRSVNGYGLEDALSLVPGVIAQSRYGTSDVRLMIRGFGARGAGDRSNSGTSRGVRVLIDGFPETEPDGRTAFDHIDLAGAEAVEVIRSNASSSFGNAAGGVVNVFTAPNISSRFFEIQPIVGSFGLQRYAVRAGAPLGNGVAFATFTNSTLEGWRKHSDARRAVLNAGIVGPIGSNTRLGVYLVAANNLMHIPGPLTQAQMDADREQANPTYVTRDERRYNRLGRLGVAVDHSFDAKTSMSSMFYINPKYLQRSERGTFRDFTRFHFGGNLIGRKEITTGSFKSRFTLGLDNAYQDGSIQYYRQATLTQTRSDTLRDNKGEGANNFGVFFHDDLTINDKLSLLLGARYDRVAYYYRNFIQNAAVKVDTRDFDRVSPRVGFTWKLSGTSSLYGNIGGGIEVPAGNETDPTATAAAPTPIINPLLDAITSTTYELGLKSVANTLGGMTLGYDLALYDTEVQNEIIPYAGGAYYATAGRARRNGLEIGANASMARGIFGTLALTLSNNKYVEYVVDSGLVNASKAGLTADLSDNRIVGIPQVIANGEIGMEVPMYRNLRVKAGIEHYGMYYADDTNKDTIPAYTVVNLTAELRKPIITVNGYSARGFVTVHNVADTKYVGSAFLNPDVVGGAKAVFEPGSPRSVIVSISVGRLR